MEFIVIPDTAIFAVNCGKRENESSNIIYRDKQGKLHSIDFDTCAANFKAENATSTDNCIGERKKDEYCFVFYTSGIKTKIVFKKCFVGNISHYHLLSSSRASRFMRLQKLISETKYIIYDLT